MNKNKFHTNIGLLLAIQCFLIIPFMAIGQAKSLNNNYNNYLSLTIQPTIYQPLSITQLEGKKILKSSPAIGGAAYLNLIQHINKKITLSFGMGLEVIPHYFRFSIADSMSNYFVDLIKEEIMLSGMDNPTYFNGIKHNGLKYYEYDQLSYNMGFSVLLNLKKIKHRNLFMELSPQFKYIGNSSFSVSQSIFFFGDYPDIENVDVYVFRSNLDHTATNNEYYRWLPSISLALGLQNINKRNYFQTKIFINYVPKLISTGEFAFYELSKPNNGTLKHRINNIGLSFTFGLATKKTQQ